MFERTSRYYDVETATLTVTGDEGEERVVSYKRRRFIPRAGDTATLVEHTVNQGERLDNITARYLGDPTQYWRVCDANNVFRPDELEEPGRVVKIDMPQV